MSDYNFPLVTSPEQEKQLRSLYRGAYHVKYTCPFTQRELDEQRLTRLEYPSPVPVEIPVALRRPETTDDKIRRLMNETREWEAWQAREEESEDDEMDFDNNFDDPDLPASPYEFVAQATSNIRRRLRIRDYKQERAERSRAAPEDAPEPSDDEPPTSPADNKEQPKRHSKVDSQSVS